MKSHNYPQLQHVVAEAIYDEAFRERLLNGDRRRVIAKFALPQDERDALLAVEADTLEGLAQGLLCWMKQRNGVRPGA